MAAWLKEQVEEESGAVERSSVLFASWKDWAERAGEPAGSQKKLSQKLEDRDSRRATTDVAVSFHRPSCSCGWLRDVPVTDVTVTQLIDVARARTTRICRGRVTSVTP